MSASAPADDVRVTAPAATRRPARHRLAVIASANGAPARLVALASVPNSAWDDLCDRAIDSNAYCRPLWAIPVACCARGRGNPLALVARDRAAPERLTGMMPVSWARSALSLPMPMLVAWYAYAPFAVPLLDRDTAVEAAGALIDAAKASGACALLLQGIATESASFAAVRQALEQRGLHADTLRSFRRAALDATQDGEAALRAALSAKKLKELRRQRHRLEDAGAVRFEVAALPDRIGPALEAFLALEAKGWKGECGTALTKHEGDAAFIREAAPLLAAQGRFEIASLVRNGETLASGLILRDRDRAFFFKIAMDENEARKSPGVQLTLELTRYLCADPRIAFADSSADGDHPMIDHVWRKRIEIADVFVALSPRDPLAAICKALVLARYRAIDFARAIRRIREKLS